MPRWRRSVFVGESRRSVGTIRTRRLVGSLSKSILGPAWSGMDSDQEGTVQSEPTVTRPVRPRPVVVVPQISAPEQTASAAVVNGRGVAPPPVVPVVPAQAENASDTQPSNQSDPPTSVDGSKTPTKRAKRKLRYADWFLTSGCNWDRVAGPDGSARSLYPKELLDYAPDAQELLLFIWEEPGCPRAKATRRVSVQNFGSIPTPGNVPAVSLPSNTAAPRP